MIPTFYSGDVIYASKYEAVFGEIRRGDIVVFGLDEGGGEGGVGVGASVANQYLFIKRVIGLPGEQVVIKDRKVEIDGKVLNEPYIRPGGKTKIESFENPVLTADADGFVYNIPEGEYFVLGDNREASIDSRSFVNEFVSREEIVGKFVIVSSGVKLPL